MTDTDEPIRQKGDMTQEERDKCVEHSDEPIPRHEPANPYKYSQSDLAKRSNTIKTMSERYPATPYTWIQNLYDILEHKSLEEIRDIIDNRKWEGAPKERGCGGVIKDALCMLEPGEDPHKPRPCPDEELATVEIIDDTDIEK